MAVVQGIYYAIFQSLGLSLWHFMLFIIVGTVLYSLWRGRQYRIEALAEHIAEEEHLDYDDAIKEAKKRYKTIMKQYKKDKRNNYHSDKEIDEKTVI